EHRVICCNTREHLRVRARCNREVPLHSRLESLQIGLQQCRLLCVLNRAQPKALPETASLQGDFSGGLGVTHPLRAPAWSDQKSLAIHFQQVDRRRVELAALPSADLQQIVMLQPKSEPNEEPKGAIEGAL